MNIKFAYRKCWTVLFPGNQEPSVSLYIFDHLLSVLLCQRARQYPTMASPKSDSTPILHSNTPQCCMRFISEDAFQKWKIVFFVRLPSSENRSRAYLLLWSSSGFRSSSYSSDFLAEAGRRKSHTTTRLNKNGFHHNRVFAELLSESFWEK